MRIQITTRHFDLSPNFKTAIEERVQKLKRYFEQIMDVTVILESEKKVERVEIKLHTNGHDIVGSGEAAEMGAALEQAVDRTEAQLKKLKDRITDRKGRTSLGEALAPNVSGPDSNSVEIEE